MTCLCGLCNECLKRHRAAARAEFEAKQREAEQQRAASDEVKFSAAMFGARLAIYLGEMGVVAMKLARTAEPEMAAWALEEVRRINRDVERSLAEFTEIGAPLQ